MSARALDQLACPLTLVTRQVVHHHDVAGPELLDQHLLDERLEHIPVHRAINDHRAPHAFDAQCRDERGCLPMAVRRLVDQTLALGARPRSRDMLVFAPFFRLGLVDEDQPSRVDAGLRTPPRAASAGDIGAVLLGRMDRLFLKVRPSFFSTK